MVCSNLDWENVGKEELERLYYLEDLSDNQIAEKYNITKGKVTYRRRKYNINMINKKSYIESPA